MSRVVIIAVGSRGDVAPLTGLAAALHRSGHDVAVAAYTPFADMVIAAGARFLDLPATLPAPEDGTDAEPAKGLAAFASPTGMRALAADVVAAVVDEPADVLLLSPFAEMAGHPLAEAKAVPSLGVRLQPLSATASYPPAVLGAWTAGTLGNRAVAHLGIRLVDRVYGGVVADVRRRLGLPKRAAGRLRAQRTATNWPVLHGYSTHVLPRPADWRDGLDVTGYWWPTETAGWRPPAELTAFLDAGPPPVFVGFGSMMMPHDRASRLSNTIRSAARRADVRVVLQAGWADLSVHDETVLTIGDTPHDWLFPRMSAVAHHCGAGTTAAGIRFGAPTIALPAYGDGPFWAERIETLGICAANLNQRRLSADDLARAMHTAVTDSGLRANAERLGALVAAEDGSAAAVAALETALDQSN